MAVQLETLSLCEGIESGHGETTVYTTGCVTNVQNSLTQLYSQSLWSGSQLPLPLPANNMVVIGRHQY